MGVRKDLKRAKQRSELADRVTVELIREGGAVREARSSWRTPPPAARGTTADIPFTGAEQDPDAVVLRRREAGRWIP
ncbi:long-chain fatty acid--CoA ligase, partial [Streptomyces sp. URMC 126]